jgi:hypothetical protein
MPNITFSFDEDLLREVKVLAARYDTSLNSLVRDYFQHLSESGLSSGDRLDGNLQTLFLYSIGRLTREETCASLGVDDLRLTQLLRGAGFPPPRSPKSDEESQIPGAMEVLE